MANEHGLFWFVVVKALTCKQLFVQIGSIHRQDILKEEKKDFYRKILRKFLLVASRQCSSLDLIRNDNHWVSKPMSTSLN